MSERLQNIVKVGGALLFVFALFFWLFVVLPDWGRWCLAGLLVGSALVALAACRMAALADQRSEQRVEDIYGQARREHAVHDDVAVAAGSLLRRERIVDDVVAAWSRDRKGAPRDYVRAVWPELGAALDILEREAKQ